MDPRKRKSSETQNTSRVDEKITKQLGSTCVQQTSNDDSPQLRKQTDFPEIVSPERSPNDGDINKTPEDSASDQGAPKKMAHISRLPPEILSKIFQYVESDKEIRSVCRTWHEAFYRDKITRLKIPEGVCPRFLENTEISRMTITFENVSLNKLPTIFWQKVGPKIHSLNLSKCELGPKVMKNVIIFSINLKKLRIVLRCRKADRSLGDPTILESINVTREQLESLEIVNSYSSSHYDEAAEHDFVMWKRIGTVFYKIFPNVIHNTYGGPGNCIFYPDTLKFTFSKNSGASPSNLGTCIASFMTSINDQDIGKTFSTIRLTAVSIVIVRGYVSEKNVISIGNLFSSQRELTSIKIRTSYHSMSKLNLIMEKILDNCSELRYFDYKYHQKHLIFTPEWMRRLALEWITKIFNIENFSFGLTKLSDGSRLVLSGHQFFNEHLITLFPNLNRVQHLTLSESSDELLQSIFQHMTHLKTLKLFIGNQNTNFGLSGRRHPSNLVEGYSISRLQNLEQLRIYCLGNNFKAFNSAIYKEFHFPKLHYLRCFPPKAPSSFALPSLKKIDFTHRLPERNGMNPYCFANVITVEDLINFCRFTDNLHTLRVIGKNYLRRCTRDDAERIFSVCPSLRILYFEDNWGLYYFDPFTKEIRYCVRNLNP